MNVAGDDYGIMSLLRTLHKVGAMEQLPGLAERAVASDDVTGPCWTAELLMALHDIGADEQIAALLARDPGAHAKMTELEPSHAIDDLIMMLHRVGADAQATAFAERIIADTDPDDVLAISTLLMTMHEAGMEPLVRDLLRSDPVARVDLTDTFVVGTLLDALVTVGADAEVAALLACDPVAHADLTSPHGVERLLEQFEEMGAHAQVAALLARAPFKQINPRYSELAEDYRFGRTHGGRPAAPWGWDDLE